MSDTPQTDSQLLTVKDCSYVAPHPTGEYVRADFARQLERENAALRKENRKAHDMACEDAVERYRLDGDNAALRADAERYRYIKNSETMEVSEILQSFCVSITFDLDAAIDAARKEGQP